MLLLPLLACASPEAPTSTLVAPTVAPSTVAPGSRGGPPGAGPVLGGVGTASSGGAGALRGRGALLYVPAWSSVWVGEGQPYDLTVTLAVRNLDREHPLEVTRVDWQDAAGRVVHRYVEAPTAVGPLATATTLVRASDTRAGVGGSFLVAWRAADVVVEPLVEAVMIGSTGQQGISFVRDGVVLERDPPAGAPP